MKNILVAILSFVPIFLFAQQDPVINTPVTADVVAKGLKAEAKAIGTVAYQWGYPLVRMEQIARTYTTVSDNEKASSYRAPVNTIGWARELPSHRDTDMPSANNDTYYMSSILVLNEPYIITTPDTKDRYYVIDVFDMYHNLTDYIGRRTTGTEEGSFLVVPPHWKGEIPQGIKKVIRPKTDKVWLWGRIEVAEGDIIKDIHRLQDLFSLKMLNGEPANLPKWENHEGEFAFYYNLAQAMSFNEVGEEEKALVGLFEKIGIKNGKFNPELLSAYQLDGLREALKEAPLSVVANTMSAGENRNGWIASLKLDNFGYDYGLRALVSGPYLGGQGAEEAMYPIRYVDSENKPLSGDDSYTLRFDSMPEVNAFWSVTVYDADTKMLIDNPINRYKISSTTKRLNYTKNGGLEITLSNSKPENRKANWLPTPKGEFYLLLRLYQPQQSLINGSSPLPQVYKN